MVCSRLHFDEVLKDEFCLGWVRHEGGRCDTLDIRVGLGEVAHFSWMVSGQGRGLAAWKVGQSFLGGRRLQIFLGQPQNKNNCFF